MRSQDSPSSSERSTCCCSGFEIGLGVEVGVGALAYSTLPPPLGLLVTAGPAAIFTQSTEPLPKVCALQVSPPSSLIERSKPIGLAPLAAFAVAKSRRSLAGSMNRYGCTRVCCAPPELAGTTCV